MKQEKIEARGKIDVGRKVDESEWTRQYGLYTSPVRYPLSRLWLYSHEAMWVVSEIIRVTWKTLCEYVLEHRISLVQEGFHEAKSAANIKYDIIHPEQIKGRTGLTK